MLVEQCIALKALPLMLLIDVFCHLDWCQGRLNLIVELCLQIYCSDFMGHNEQLPLKLGLVKIN